MKIFTEIIASLGFIAFIIGTIYIQLKFMNKERQRQSENTELLKDILFLLDKLVKNNI